MRKALVTIGAILVAMLGALFIVPAFIDWNRYRGELEEEVSRVIGREVRVGGGVSLRLLPFPYVSFEKVRITDNSGALGEPFFRADAFTMWLSVAPLLNGTIEASEVELRRPVVTLAVDAAGAGNWADFKASQGSLPFVPAHVTLQALNIIDGVVQVQGPNQAEIIRVENLFGELSAEAIDGPYKFRGTAKWRGLPREIRFATAKAEADGSVRFKGNVRAEDTGSSYVIDARVVDLRSRPRIDGDLTANLTPPAASASGEAPAKRGADGQAGMLEFKAKLTAEPTKAALSDILITFDQGGQPQLATGGADLAWIGGPKMRVQLGSRWLDLDKLSGAKAGDQPFDSVRTLVAALTSLLPDAGEVESAFNVDQVNLGGEAVSGLRLRIARASGPLQVHELKASMPGGTRLELNGVIASGQKGMGFLGDVGLRGASYARFMSWSAKGSGAADHRNDGPFSMSGRLSLAEGGIEVTEAIAELLGTPLTGEIRYRWDGRRQLAITLEGQQVDVSALIPGGLDLATARDLFWPGPATAAKPAQPAAPPRGIDTKGLDLKLRLRAAEVALGDGTLRDVDADVAIAGGKLTVPALRLTTPEGLGLELEGDVVEVGAPKPKGALRWVVDAADAAAINSLSSLMGTAAEDLPAPAVIEALLPVRMAGSLRFGSRTDAAQDVTFDGLIKGSRVLGSLKLDGGFKGWRQAPVDLNISGEASDAARLLSLVWSGAADKGAKQPAQQPAGQGVGKFAFRAIGQPVAGMLSLAAVETSEATLHYDGKVSLPRPGTHDLDGVIRLAASDAEQVLVASGVGLRGGRTGVSIQGTADLYSKDGTIRIAARQMKLGQSELVGNITLTPQSGTATARFDATLDVGAATVPGLLSLLLDRRQTAGSGSAGPVWPDEPFDLAAIDSLAGRIVLRTRSLMLAPGVSLANAVLEANLGGGKLELAKLEGQALGGTFNARANLERATAGAVVSGALRLDGAGLAALVPGAAEGPLGFNLQFDGKALSPRAMIAVLTGKGELEIGKARVARSAPGALQALADDFIENRGEIAGEPLKQAVLQALAPTQLGITPRKVGLQLADGTIKAQRATIESDGGRTIVDTVIDIASLKVDSEWKLEPKTPRRATTTQQAGAVSGGLPSVSIVYVGTLGQLAAIEPRLNVEALERELAVRRMERDVEELEKVRRLDEERARIETERLRALEAERMKAIEEDRAKAAAAAAAAASPAQTSPPAAAVPSTPQTASQAEAVRADPSVTAPQPDAGGAAARPGAKSASGSKPSPKSPPFRPFSDTGQFNR